MGRRAKLSKKFSQWNKQEFHGWRERGERREQRENEKNAVNPQKRRKKSAREKQKKKRKVGGKGRPEE